MFRFLTKLAAKSRPGRYLAVVTAAAILAAGGCQGLSLRGERFADEPMSDLARRLRVVDGQAESFAFSNKARQIERDCGIE